MVGTTKDNENRILYKLAFVVALLLSGCSAQETADWFNDPQWNEYFSQTGYSRYNWSRGSVPATQDSEEESDSDLGGG